MLLIKITGKEYLVQALKIKKIWYVETANHNQQRKNLNTLVLRTINYIIGNLFGQDELKGNTQPLRTRDLSVLAFFS